MPSKWDYVEVTFYDQSSPVSKNPFNASKDIMYNAS